MINPSETNAAVKFERWLASHPPPPVVLAAPRRPACFQIRPRRAALFDQPSSTVIDLPSVASFAWPVFTTG